MDKYYETKCLNPLPFEWHPFGFTTKMVFALAPSLLFSELQQRLYFLIKEIEEASLLHQNGIQMLISIHL